MSLHLYAENNDGDIVEWTDRLRADTLEVNISAAEMSAGESTIVIDDPDGDFYIRGHKPLYLIETDAEDDDRLGVIGLFYSWSRREIRGNARTEAGREVHVSVKDINTLATRRLQKGTDAKREEETDVVRIVDWLTNTAEVIGGFGDNGLSIEDRDFLFTDSPYTMSETDYTAQDTAGVVDDALQDSGKNAFLFVSPIDGQIIRVGMWYGRTEREDYASVHRISNVPTDIDIDATSAGFTMTPAELLAGEWTFPPSIDSELDRDPSRVYSGAMVQYDGGYEYATRTDTRDAFASRDGVFPAELVKNGPQAQRRAQRYLRDLRNEDDAITTAVIVPSALVNAFCEGQRVQVRFSHLSGYGADFVWMRVANRTVRQLSAGSLLYELALDLRAEEPPDSSTTGTGGVACPNPTAAGTFYPLGAMPASDPDGVIYYLKPGPAWPDVPTPGYEFNGWHFPQYGAGGSGTEDFAGDCAENRLRVMVVGDGTVTVDTEVFGPARDMMALLFHSDTDPPESVTPFALGDAVVVEVSTHGGTHCVHWVDIRDSGPVCGSKWGWTSATWDPA